MAGDRACRCHLVSVPHSFIMRSSQVLIKPSHAKIEVISLCASNGKLTNTCPTELLQLPGKALQGFVCPQI